MTFKRIALGDLCEFRYGNSLPERKRTFGSIPVYGSNGIVGYHSESVTQGETIIVGRKGSIGEVHYSGGPCFPIDTTYYISETKRECNLRWLFYMLCSLRLTELNKSSAVPGLNRNDAYEKRLIFPPLPIQKQIATILEKADSAREKRRQANQRTEQLLQSAFVEMFGDPVTNPKGWEKKPLVSLCDKESDLRCGPFGSQLKKQHYQSEGIPVWDIEDVKAQFKKAPRFFVSNKKAEELSNYYLQAADIVMTRRATIGLCAVYPALNGPGIMHSALLRIRTNQEVAHSSFLSHQLSTSKDVEHQISQFSSGAIFESINVSKLKAVRVILPPMREQLRFVDLIAKVESLRAKQKESERDLENLFNGLMQRAFKGELVQ
ncbi:MAG: restriction endonuclease subunit S [Ignavibacteria bacterium]|nr:restriction endonuclease subunit S [Ignavibacteria bacterium]